MISPDWSSLSESEKNAALKTWNEDYDRRNPYVPPGGYSTWWDVGRLVLLCIAIMAGAVLLRRQIAAFFTTQTSLIVVGVAILAIHLLNRVDKCDKEIEELREKLRTIERGDVQSSK